MTLVVAAVGSSSTFLGGDSFCGTQSLKEACALPKVYQHGPLGVGIAGNVVSENTLAGIVRGTQDKKINEVWLLAVLPQMFREALIEQSAAEEHNSRFFIPDESEYIFAMAGKLYYMDNEFGVWESGHKFAAIGAAKEIAMGAMAMGYHRSRNKKALVERALKVGAEFAPMCSGPFNVIEVEY